MVGLLSFLNKDYSLFSKGTSVSYSLLTEVTIQERSQLSSYCEVHHDSLLLLVCSRTQFLPMETWNGSGNKSVLR